MQRVSSLPTLFCVHDRELSIEAEPQCLIDARISVSVMLFFAMTRSDILCTNCCSVFVKVPRLISGGVRSRACSVSGLERSRSSGRGARDSVGFSPIAQFEGLPFCSAALLVLAISF